MKRTNAFEDLLWDKVVPTHEQKWNLLHDYFGFSGKDILRKETEMPLKNILSILAESCVRLCQELLFSLEPIEHLGDRAERYGDAQDFDRITRIEMENALKYSLYDHLVLSFSYRFFCENLAPQKLRWYSDALYDFQNSSVDLTLLGEKTNADRKKIDDYRNRNREYESYIKKLADIAMEDDDKDKESLKNQLKLEFNENSISPPDSWFLIFLLSVWNPFSKMLLDVTKDKHKALLELVSDLGLSTMLLPMCNQADGSSGLPHRLIPMRRAANYFVGIPIPTGKSEPFHIPTNDYHSRKEGEMLRISSRLQMAFNNYLFEKNLHLHATVTMREIFARADVNEIKESAFTNGMLGIVQLNAPIIQAAFINFMGTNLGTKGKEFLIKRYVNRWNNHALPILEELFVWGVWEMLKTPKDVVAAIENWIEDEDIYERVLAIKMVRSKKIKSTRSDSKIYNQIIDYIFANGGNLAYYDRKDCSSSNVPAEIPYIKPFLQG